MHIQPDHCLSDTSVTLSPNREPRGPAQRVELVVLHCISLPLGAESPAYVHDLFANRLDVDADPSFADLAGVRVSAHLLIDRGGLITQYVPFDEQAWHAGVSSWRGRPGCNRYSIGIELLGTDDGAFTARQYATLVEILRLLFAAYPALHMGAVVGHEEVAPGRKSDPGTGFDWPRLYAGLAGGR